jgi:Fe-S cluster assembly protein SufB
MSSTKMLEDFANKEYEHGFVTEVDQDVLPPGLDEDVIRTISARKNEPEWLLEWRLKAFAHWQTMEEPHWPMAEYPPVDYQAISYFAAPKKQLESLDEVDPEILATYEKLGIPLEEQKILAGVAVDAVFDSVSVATTFKDKLAELGIIFCSFSEAVQEHPELVKRAPWIGGADLDNFFATLNSAVFTDGSFVYIPKGVRCPMELSTYFRINAQNTGQFERTLIVADEESYVSYLEGCTAPSATRISSTPQWWNSSPSGTPRSSTPPSRTGTRRQGDRRGRHLQLRHQARYLPRRPGQDQLDPGRDRIVHHLEVPVGDPQGRRLGGRVLLGGPDRRAPAGRHRHQDDPPGQQHQSTIISKGISAGRGQNTYRGLVKVAKNARDARNFSQCDSMLIGDRCGAHTFPYHRHPQSHGSAGARGDHLEDRRGPDLLLQPARPGHRGRRVHDRQRLLQGGLLGAPDGVRGGGPEAARREPRGLGGVEGSRMNVLRRRSAPRARAQSASENTRRTHGYASVFRRHLNSEPTAHLIRSGRSSWIHDTRRTQSAASALGRTEGRTCSN